MYDVNIIDDEGREMHISGANVIAIAGSYGETTGIIDAAVETLAQWIAESPRLMEAAKIALKLDT